LDGNFTRQTSPITVSGSDQRASVHFNLTHKSLDQKLTISFTNTYGYTTSDMVNIGASVTLPPDAPAIFNSEGQLNYAGWGNVNSTNRNSFPFATLLQPYTSNTNTLYSDLTLNYSIAKGLNFNANAGYNTIHNSQIQLYPIAAQDPALNPTGRSYFGNNNSTNTIIEPDLEYKTIIGRGKFNGIIGANYNPQSYDGNTIFGSGFTNDNLLMSVGNAPQVGGSNSSGQEKHAALFARISYNWEDKYIVNLSARRDGSSLFGPGHQYGNFGSVGAAWIFTQEDWVKNNLGFLSFGKLRGSYGTRGTDEILPAYQYLSSWSAENISPYQPGGPASYVPTNLYNANLQWEVDKSLEGALDLGFLKDRLTFEISFYQNRIGNQLISYNLPTITGFTSVYANSPALVQNTGQEITLKYKIIDRSNITWAVNFDVGFNQNKLLAFPNLAQSSYATQYTIGQPLNIGKLLHAVGVDPLTGQYVMEEKNQNGTIVNYYNNGYNDLYDYNLSVKYDGGFGTDLTYKAFSLHMFFHFRNKQEPAAIFESTPGGFYNESSQIVNQVWQKPGDIAQYARYTTNGASSDQYFASVSDGIYGSGAFIRLQNAALSYDLPNGKLAKSLGIAGLRIFVRGENLLLFTKYDGIDPETPSLGALPYPTTIICGLQFKL